MCVRRPSSSRLLRLFVILLCVMLVVPPALFRHDLPVASAQGGGAQPEPGAPAPDLPDLDAARTETQSDPTAPPEIPSTQVCNDCEPCPECNANHAPVSNPGGPYAGAKDQPIVFDGGASFDPDGDELTYRWNFGDGSQPVTAGAVLTHAYSSPGTYTLTLTVTDPGGLSGSNSTPVAVSGQPPTPEPTPAPSPVFDGASFVSQSVTTEVQGGRAYAVSVRMKNTGNTTWTGSYLYRLGAWNPQDNTTWGVTRATLPHPVAPNEEVTFDFMIIAPPGGYFDGEAGGYVPNPYNFQWRMLKDGVDGAVWFGDPSQNVVVNSYDNYAPYQSTYSPSSHYTARLEPGNRTGAPGEDLLSGNYNWSLPLVGLRGRAGLDLGLSVSYNSLVWTPVQNSMVFDADHGFPSPGFHLGFPTIQQRFYNDQAQATRTCSLRPPAGASSCGRSAHPTSTNPSTRPTCN